MRKPRLRLLACTLTLLLGCAEAPTKAPHERTAETAISDVSLGDQQGAQRETSRPWILPQHQQGAVFELIDGFSPQGGSLVFRSHGIDGNTVRFHLVDRTSGAVERPLATLSLAERSTAKAGETTSRSFAMRRTVLEDSDGVRAALEMAVERVRAGDVGGYYVQPAPMREVQEQTPTEASMEERSEDERETSVLWVPILVLVLLIGALFVQVRRVTWQEVVSVNVKPTHLLPSVLQLTLLTYWGLHWHEFSTRAHFIAIELAYAYFLEMSLSVLVLGHWRLSFGPIPIVLSTNLFVQYTSYEELVMMGIALTVAISSKILIRPGGRHVFNPSALGLAVIGAIWLLLDGSSDMHTWRVMEIPDGDIAHELNLAPNMAELIVLIAVIAHLRVPVVLITISGFMAMIFCGPIYQEMAPAPDWAPIVLVLALLITDPATSPKTSGGRILFGFTTGFLISSLSVALESNGISDFYSKVIPVPLVNAMVPNFDAWGAKLTERMRLLGTGFDRWHVAAWLCVFFLYSAVRDGKKHAFLSDDHMHLQNKSRFVTVNPEGEITCEDNPVHCSILSFPAEIGCWIEELGDGEGCGNL